MKKLTALVASAAALVIISGCDEIENHDEARLKAEIPRIFERADKQFRILSAACEAETQKTGKWMLPRTTHNGKIVFSDVYWWTSGFFPGSLWLLYE